MSRSLAACMSCAKQYNKLVQDTEFFVGDMVMVYNPQFDKEVGRKLQSPWRGPYRVEEVLKSISYMV